MSLSTGTRLGPYEIVAAVGAGGMGEVYRGIDTRLQREVAIKQSLQPFGDRFQREARAIAALNHPHVCTLYDVGPDYLVMEWLDGETLTRRIERGPMPLDQAIRTGTQIAEALAAAHAKGIIHRDLKPGNVMLTSTGAKVLDFGVAVFGDPTADTVNPTVGVIGTPAYMSPEQLAGRPADARTDIFALGLVLHELITGRRPAVSPGEPLAPLSALPDRLAHVVTRCLAADPDRRWHSARDVARELEWAGQKLDIDSPGAPKAGSRRLPALLAAVMAVAGVVAGMGLDRLLAPAAGPEVSTRTVVPLPEGRVLDSGASLALSPDGRQLAFVAIDDTGRRDLFLRELSGEGARLISGSAGAMHPFFAPDGRDVAFFADGYLQRVGVDAAATPFRICQIEGVDRGGTWSPQGIIVVAIRELGLLKVPASGGPLEPVPGAANGAWPSFLPDGRTILYAERAPAMLNGYSVVALDGTGRRAVARRSDVEGSGEPVLGAGAEVMQGSVLAGGYLVYGQDPGSVRALPVDPATLAFRGPSLILADSVDRGPAQSGIAFAVGPGGLLAYGGTGSAHRLVWVTRQGVVTPIQAEADAYRLPRLSPDGLTIAVTVNDATRTPHVWLVDAVQGGRTRIATEALMPVWTPDGRHVAINGGGAPLTMTTPGGGASRPLITRAQISTAGIGTGRGVYPTSISPDGGVLMLQVDSQDVWKLTVGAQRLEPLLTSAADEWDGVISPDGRAVAYTSEESGRAEVYVAEWPSFERRSAVSTRGGMVPRWSRDAGELFYWQGRTLMAARVAASLRASPPQPLFSGMFSGASGNTGYDVAADGRFLMVQSDPKAARDEVTILQHWAPLKPQ